jgi:hypothetical protein
MALPATTGAGAEATNVLRELKGTSVGTGMGQMEVATLDIMAMLFDQIFDDRKIPDGMKWLISRLQIPMLKVAILDKAFFSTRTHPARQLLDTLGEIAVGLPADIDSSNPLYKRVETTVEKLLAGFEDNLEIFEALRLELQEVVTQENERVEESTRSTTKRIEQNERLGVAKAVAREEIKARLQSGQMPKVIIRFLAQQWIKVLLTVYAKRGKDGEAWKSALETMDELIWSVRSKPSREDLRRLASLLPGLLKRLAAGMQIVGTAEETRKRFLADLMKLHTQAMNSAVTRSPAPAERTVNAGADAKVGTDAKVDMDAEVGTDAKVEPVQPVNVRSEDEVKAASPTSADQVPAPSEASTAEPTAGDESESDSTSLDFTTVVVKNPFGQGEIEVDEIELPSVPGAPAAAVKEGDKYSQLASSLKAGTWLEFRHEKQRHQVKLSYISPFKTAYLFVNWQGQTVGKYSLPELAAEMRAGRVKVMNEGPLFDRAMNGLMSALRG